MVSALLLCYFPVVTLSSWQIEHNRVTDLGINSRVFKEIKKPTEDEGDLSQLYITL